MLQNVADVSRTLRLAHSATLNVIIFLRIAMPYKRTKMSN